MLNSLNGKLERTPFHYSNAAHVVQPNVVLHSTITDQWSPLITNSLTSSLIINIKYRIEITIDF